MHRNFWEFTSNRDQNSMTVAELKIYIRFLSAAISVSCSSSLGGFQGRSGQVRQISPLPGFDPRTVQPIASSYTDCDTSANVLFKEGKGQTLFRERYEE